MSDREKAQLGKVYVRNAAMMGVVIGIVSSLSSILLRNHFGLGEKFGIHLLFSTLIALVVGFLLLPCANRSLKVFLASTEYAKSQGIAAENLRICSFGSNRE